MLAPRRDTFITTKTRTTIHTNPAYVDEYDVLVSALFENPYDATEHDFSYGFLLRSNWDSPSVWFYILSDGSWHVTAGENRHKGTALGLNTLKHSLNRLEVFAVGKYVIPLLNGVRLTNSLGDNVFYIGSETDSGDVLIGNGFVEGSDQNGAITHFQAFEVYRIIPEGLVEDARKADIVTQGISEELPFLKSSSVVSRDRP